MTTNQAPPDEDPCQEGTYAAKAFLLSPAELRFFQALKRVISRSIYIVPKVRLADVVSWSKRDTSHVPLARIAQKHLDFVLVDVRYTRIIAAIELDDRSHEVDSTLRRDRFVNSLLNKVGIPLLRVQATSSYNEMVLEQQLTVMLSARPRRQRIRGGFRSKTFSSKRSRSFVTKR